MNLSSNAGALIAAIMAGLAVACAPPPAGTMQGATSPAATDPHPRKAWVAACQDGDAWDKPGPPFRIHGNSYYVGTCGIAAILITGSQGHVLIDTGTEAGARIVAANISSLGFRPEDVKLLLHSHEHYDHVGGMAIMQGITGARLLASFPAAPVLSSGEAGAGDPQAGLHAPMAPARVDGSVRDGEPVRLGDVVLTPVATPGHTPGALTWAWTSCEGRDCRAIVFADSLNPISRDDYRFSDHPDLVAAFRAGLERLAGLDCAILITPHPGSSAMRDRLKSPEGLAGPPHCRDYAGTVRARLDARLAKEAGQ